MKQDRLALNRWTRYPGHPFGPGSWRSWFGAGQKLDITNPHGRNLLVVRVRWIVLGLFALYGLFSGLFLSATTIGLFLSPMQLAILCGTVTSIALYNLIYQFASRRFHAWPVSSYVQVLLDFLAITLLVHFSGGDGSYFWPAYLIVTLEASILLERRREVYLLGALGSLCYGALLWLEHVGWLPYVEMPFVSHEVHASPVYLVLLWVWVVILNATAAAIGTFLMGAVRREHRAVQASEERLVDFLNSANDLIFCFSREGRICYANRAWRAVMAQGEADLAGAEITTFLAEEFQGEWREAVERTLAGDSAEPFEVRLHAANGEQVEVEGHFTLGEDEEGEPRLWALFRDITARKRAEAQLYHLAHHDTLTGLPNRLLFMDRVQHALALARRMKNRVAVFFLDLDRFKIINDTLGHAAGDQLLMRVAWRLSGVVREIDTVARMGGDEFTVLVSALRSDEDARAIGEKILEALRQPLDIEGNILHLTASVGIAVAQGLAEETPAALIKRADLAMYHAKGQGRNLCHFYHPDMDQEAQQRFNLERDLRLALDEQQFVLHYQPKVNLATGEITALEALVRWQHPEIGLLLPNDFISLAEECGFIVELGQWALAEACRQNRRWQEEGLEPVRVAVNLSGYQLQERGFVDQVRTILAQTGLDPCWLELEITETILMQNPDFAIEVLGSLTGIGVHLSIDDFGTGYSSLAQIKRFAVNTLKIDKSFVRDLERSQTDAAITSAIISMGNSLNMQVIAEGVETRGQMEFLRRLQCHEMQGFLVSRPLPPEEITPLLRESLPRNWQLSLS